MARRLSRARDGRPAPPIRIVHLGLGNFFRAHQAWYTDRASDADQWGIAAFSGRATGIGPELTRQGTLYTLATVGSDRNEFEVVSSLSACHRGTDVRAFLDYLADPDVTVVTVTITEVGYARNDEGDLDVHHPDIAYDIEAIAADNLPTVRSAVGKLVAGLLTRQRASAGPINVVACDLLPDNGAILRRVVTQLASRSVPDLNAWIDDNAGFVTTMVDRITPRATEATRQAVLDERQVDDPAALGTEPFSEWVLQNDFTAPRPDWESAGAVVVDDLVPHERRKLWLLNGAHSLLAYAGTIKGHRTASDAIADPIVRGWVEEWWDVAQRQLTLPDAEVEAYRSALLQRFANRRMRDQLSRIAADGSQKLPARIVPALVADRRDGNSPLGAERVVAAWTLHLRGLGAPFNDARADTVRPFGDGTVEDSVRKVCDYLDIADSDARASILSLALRLGG